MSKEFPHLNDTFFPGVKQVDPYKTANRFDYTRWDAGTTVTLCNVNWCGDYDNVVKFADDEARDAYFDKLGGDTIRLESAYRILPDGEIKLPVPFDEVVKYNYLVVDFSTATSNNNLLDFETDKHTKRFHFFVDDCAYAAPNTTALRVRLDVWTTYINRIEVNYMMLERGHAPLAHTSAAEYLSNPIANNRYLLADDFSFGTPAITKNQDWIPFGSGTKYVLVATTVPFDGLGDLGRNSYANPAGPTYYTTGDRSGYQAGVAALDYAAGGEDFEHANLTTSTAQVSGGSIPNNLTVFAVKASLCFGKYGTFFSELARRFPQFLQTIQAIYVVDESMIKLGKSFVMFSSKTDRITWGQAAESAKSRKLTWDVLHNLTIDGSRLTYAYLDEYSANVFRTSHTGYTVYEVQPNNALLDSVHLSAADFGYPDEYKELAKLYTFPYAALEISDDSGRKSVVNIENTGAMNLYQKVSVAYPYLKFSAFLTGVGSDEATEYQWLDVTGRTSDESMPWGDFGDYLFEYDIPAFQLYMHGYDSYKVHNYNANNTAAELAARVDYENEARGINTAYENAKDSANKSYNNASLSIETSIKTGRRGAMAAYENALAANATGQTNTNASALNVQTNSKRSAITTLNNANDSADVSADVATNSAYNSRISADASADTSLTNAYNTSGAARSNVSTELTSTIAQLGNSNTTAATTTNYSNLLQVANERWDAKYAQDMQDAENFQSSVAGIVNAAAGVTEAISADIHGDAVKGIGLAAGAVANGVGAALSINVGNQKTELGVDHNRNKMLEANQNATDLTGLSTKLASDNQAISVNATTTTADLNQKTSNTNAKNTNTTAKANNTRAYDSDIYGVNKNKDLSKSLASRDYTTGVMNIDADYDNTTSNAARSRMTSDANAKRTYDATIDNLADTVAKDRANALRDRDVALSNAKYSRDNAINNAQRSLNLKAELARANYLDRRLDAPIAIGSASGDPVPDEMKWRGLRIRVKTQNEGAIAQAGDMFLRYGYALNQMWRFTGFNVMSNFTYWKCSDVWLCGGVGVIESAQNRIKQILTAGVTVWADPDKIGKVSIYEND